MNEQLMQSSPQVARWFVCLGLAFCLLGSRDALAWKWPGEGANSGGAIAAKVIGQLCPSVLSTSDIAELDTYITKHLSESVALEQQKSKESGEKPFPHDELLQSSTKTYEAKYRDPQNCDADAAEEARDMLQRVRKAMATGGPLISTDGAPDAGQVASARITGVMCPGALSGQEFAQLELYYGRYLMSYAKTATDEDMRYMMWHLKQAEVMQIRGWDSAKHCTTARVGKAKEVLARIPKEF